MEKIFYFAQLVGAINTIAIVLLVISIIAGIFIGLWLLFEGWYFNEKESFVFKKISKYVISIFIVGSLGVIFCPTKQTYLFMVGGRVVDELVENNPTIKEIPGNTIDLLNEYIKLETEKIRNKCE